MYAYQVSKRLCDAGIVSRVGVKHTVKAGAETGRGTETKIGNASYICSPRLLNVCLFNIDYRGGCGSEIVCDVSDSKRHDQRRPRQSLWFCLLCTALVLARALVQ